MSHGLACVLPRRAAATVITVSAIIERCVGTDPSSGPGPNPPYATVSPRPSPDRGWGADTDTEGRTDQPWFSGRLRPILSATSWCLPERTAEGDTMKIPELQGATESIVADASGNASGPDPQSPASGRGMSRQVLSGTGLSQASSRSFAAPAGNQQSPRRSLPGWEMVGGSASAAGHPLEMIPLFEGRSTYPQSAESRHGTGMSERTDGENRLERSGYGRRR